MELRDIDTFEPLGESELAEWEARARANGEGMGEEVLRLIAEIRRLRALLGNRPMITHSPGKCGGYPTIAGTRIGVHHVVALAPGYDWNLELLRNEEFPDLSMDQLRAAVEYHRKHGDEIDEALRRDQEVFDRVPLAPTRK